MEKITLKLYEFYNLEAELNGVTNQQNGEVTSKGLLAEKIKMTTNNNSVASDGRRSDQKDQDGLDRQRGHGCMDCVIDSRRYSSTPVLLSSTSTLVL